MSPKTAPDAPVFETVTTARVSVNLPDFVKIVPDPPQLGATVLNTYTIVAYTKGGTPQAKEALAATLKAIEQAIIAAL